MAGRDKNTRIEPTFDRPGRSRGSADLSVGEDDRVVQSSRGKPVRKQVKARGRQKTSRRSRGGLFAGFGRLFYWSLVLALWGGIGLVGIVVYYGAQMPSTTEWTIPDRPPNVKIVSVDGQLVANRGTTGGEALGLHEMSPFIPQAVMAIEDRRYYSHFGVDPLGLARAMVQNVIDRRVSQGGSTLTQQLAKNLFLKPERTIERKVQEVLLALWLEHKYTKDQILEMYLNRVYFGSGSYGVEAASRRYFGKSARDVTLSQAALLAGLLKAPSRLSPARDPKAAEQRAQLVLAAMRQQDRIGDKELASAMSAKATEAASYWTGSENYVADRIMDELPELIGEVRTDIIVDATVDLNLQKLAEASIRRLITEKGEKLNVSQGALVSIDNSGAVRAMVGGANYADSQFDRASEALRQPGSAFKPFVFVAALEQGRTPDSIRNDAPIKIGKWSPRNFGNKYFGKVTLSTALARSLNSVSAQLAMEVGPAAVVEVAHRLGIESKLQDNVTIALGTSEVTPLELTAAYVPFANGGYRPEVHLIQRITSVSGEVLYENTGGAKPRVLSAETVGMMNAMMKQTIDAGSGRKAAFDWPAAGKTGTSQNSRDAWFIGYTANLTTGVWFGNDNAKATNDITGGSLPVEAWREFMVAAHEGVPVAQLPGGWTRKPEGEPQSAPALEVSAPVPSSGVVQADATETAPAQRRVQRPAVETGSAPVAAEQTGSIRHPVPSADVGGPKVRREGSILDIIMGN
ncbi:PBP1A family penicillin-binding protein [Mesorhizobium sp. NBSH29]|uniref:transglycosylase domain-containing protein n=1 Tax=Mesorhizobium sp. NBSH29 TaxID=2654249 RepID=UPI0018966ED0|nr:transglycosylase domain-containing protein [Mesorhizobium sp. NBSH29]QPC86222.1 PBP1A family penicillin-binding protein [Mesorhizobium sp. NBSH29]